MSYLKEVPSWRGNNKTGRTKNSKDLYVSLWSMHIGLLLLELGINDYDLNRKNYFHTNFKLRTAKWTFLACRVNEITNLINTTDYILLLLFFSNTYSVYLPKLKQCMSYTVYIYFYPFNHSAFRRMADLMHFIRWIEPKLKRPSALRTVETRGTEAIDPLPPILADQGGRLCPPH